MVLGEPAKFEVERGEQVIRGRGDGRVAIQRIWRSGRGGRSCIATMNVRRLQTRVVANMVDRTTVRHTTLQLQATKLRAWAVDQVFSCDHHHDIARDDYR